MSAPSKSIQVQSGNPPNPRSAALISNSTTCKAFAYVPLVGIIFCVVQEAKIGNAISEERDRNRHIELLQEKNQYIVASIVNTVITIALLVVGAVAGFFSAGVGIPLACSLVLGLIAGVDAYRLFQNKRTITALQTTDIVDARFL